jgi:hypothetical protein
MPITGSHPEKGIRIELTLGKNATNLISYSGLIVTPDGKFQLEATISANGEVTISSDAPVELAEKTRLIVRTAARHAATEKSPLPRRIVRWRGDK